MSTCSTNCHDHNVDRCYGLKRGPYYKVVGGFFFLVNLLDKIFAIISCCLDCNDPDPDVDYC